MTFSHDGSFTLASHSFQARRLRKDEELLACAQKGGIIGITAVPNRLSNDPEQSIECVLDHYDYMVNLVGVDHVGIGTDTSIGDSVGVGEAVMGRPGPTPARYMNGLESPADGKNIVRGLIARGYSDEDVRKIAGGKRWRFQAGDGVRGRPYSRPPAQVVGRRRRGGRVGPTIGFINPEILL